LQEGERSKLALQLDTAEKNYHDGNYLQASQTLDAMKQLSPAAALLHGWVDLRLGDIPKARKYFSVAATAMPESTEPRLGLAYCELRENDLSTAEAHFSQLISGDAENIEALNGMGLVRFRQGRLSEAVDYFKKVLLLNPQHVEAKSTLQSAEEGIKKPAKLK
jgi:tetratricopeptide (TPR) repeat protein